jgi:hypothetical protein
MSSSGHGGNFREERTKTKARHSQQGQSLPVLFDHQVHLVDTKGYYGKR